MVIHKSAKIIQNLFRHHFGNTAIFVKGKTSSLKNHDIWVLCDAISYTSVNFGPNSSQGFTDQKVGSHLDVQIPNPDFVLFWPWMSLNIAIDFISIKMNISCEGEYKTDSIEDQFRLKFIHWIRGFRAYWIFPWVCILVLLLL